MKTLYLKAFGKIVLILLFAASMQNAAAANGGVTWVSNNAVLSSIKVTPVTTLTTVSGVDYRDYTTTVPNSESTVKITPTAQDATATIKVNGVTVASGTASAAIPLNVGDNVINTVVTAEDGITVKTYSIKFIRLSSNANLAGLTISSGVLSPVFATGTTTYSASVGNAVTSVTVTPAASNASATIKINGTTVTSGSASAALPLYVGDNVINVIVTADDGVTVKTYSLKFTRLASLSDATLSNLTLSSGGFFTAFAPGTTNYFTIVSNATASVTVTPVTSNAGATVKVNGVTVASGSASAPITLNASDNIGNTINVVVTAADGTTVKAYSIVISRPLSSNNNLAGLTLSSGTLSPVFAPGKTSYTVSVSHATASVTITPTAQDAAATIKVNDVTVASGSASAAIPLNFGYNLIRIGVTAQNGTYRSYDITINRLASTNANLAGLTISSGSLSPVFDPDITSYTVSVSNTTASVTVTPTVQDATATITVEWETVASGSASRPIPLDIGDNNVINITVRSEYGYYKYYEIRVNRSASPSNALLRYLDLSGGAYLQPVFSPDVRDYESTVSYEGYIINVEAWPVNPLVSIKINELPPQVGYTSVFISLNLGVNIVKIVVTSEDSTTVNTYSIKITRVGNTNALLNSLKLTPATTVNIAHGTNYRDYTTTVPNSETSVTITPFPQDGNASIKVNGVTVAGGTASAAIPLNVGENVINTVVTAQDGITTKTYSLKFTRLASSDASLLHLALSSGTLSPVFAPATTSYTASVSNATAFIAVTPTTGDATQIIKVNGTTVVSGSASAALPLVVGQNVITTVVTAPDGVTTKTYTITVTRPSNNAILSGLKVMPATALVKVSGPDYSDYTTMVPNTELSVTLTPKVQDVKATIKINGITVANQATSAAIPLNIGDNVINTVVTAEDGVTTKTYSINFIRPPSPNAILKSLKLTPASTVAIVSGPDYRDYVTTVPNSEASVTITPVTEDATATIKVNGVTVASGAASAAIPLNVGDNVINTVVTAQNGTTINTYSMKITRQPPAGAALSYTENAGPVLDNSLTVHQNVSPNGDGKGDVLVIDGITAYPENKL
ncbi:MAG: cadherin-like beta sandwich domain-containing protein, partial [Mucilaginibacter sp.]